MPGRYICKKCFHKKLKTNLVQKCHVCGGESRLGFTHTDCAESSFIDGLVNIVEYNEFAEKVLFEMKYNSVFSISEELGNLMAEYLDNNHYFEDYLISFVPAHNKRIKERGYNQSHLIAKQLCRNLNTTCYSLLKRVVNTKNQVGMTASERENNLRNSIQLTDRTRMAGLNIILVDDVYTTGTTLNECAKVLKAWGAKTVIGLVFAKTVKS